MATTAFRTSNPALNDKTFAPERLHTLTGGVPTDQAWRSVMTLDGVVMKSLVLLVLLVGGAAFGYTATETSELGVQLPGWIIPALLVALGVAIATIFRPLWARFTAPIYAVLEGAVLGAISAAYEFRFDGIVLQAVGLTIGVFVLMLVLYGTGTVRPTEKFRAGVIAATGAVMLVYFVSIIFRVFGSEVPMIHESGPVGILFSLAVVAIASMNLILDFDFIEKGVNNGAPKALEWYAGFGLLVTIVWLYLELLRLLSKLRSR
jgi:uncharacterized YccA/Bax inhibitor family protein